MTPRHQRGPMAALRVLLAAVAILLAQAASAEELRGRVVGITDGDTLTLLTERHAQLQIRLAEIDTPERGSPTAPRPADRCQTWHSARPFGSSSATPIATGAPRAESTPAVRISMPR